MRRFLPVLVVAAAVSAACGGETGARAGPTTVLRVVMTDDWVTAPFTDAVREFERTHPRVRVDIDRGPIGRMADVVRAGIAGGSPPDVVQGHAHTGAGQDLAEPLDDLWDHHGLTADEFLPGAVADVTWAGRRYGVPLDSNAMAVLYNTTRFRELGLSPPTGPLSFVDFERLAGQLTSPDGARRGLVVPVDTWVTFGWVRANGGDLLRVEPGGTPVFTFDSPAVVGTLDYLGRLIDSGVAFGPLGPDARSTDAYALFRSGQVAMYTSGSWDLVRVTREVPDGDFGVALMPRGLTGATAGSSMGGSSLWVPKGSPNRELAFEFMLLLTSDPYALRFAKEEGRLPVRPRVLSDPHFADPQLRVFVEQLATAHPPILGALHEASQAFGDALSRVLRERADARTALAEAQSRAVSSLAPP